MILAGLLARRLRFVSCWEVSVRLFSPTFLSWVVLLVVGFGVIGAGPSQNDRPPQPFFQDFFSGTVTLEGGVPPVGTRLIACIGDCQSGFESEPSVLKIDGTFDQLEVNPKSEGLVGHTISFYLVNRFGRIKALEERPYIGVFDYYVQDLTFDEPMPAPIPTPTPAPTAVPTPTASLPIAGDPAVTIIPKVALILGISGLVVGGALVVVARRNAA